MAKQKQERTPTEQVKHLKRISRGCFAGQFLSVAAPFITIGIVNFQEYYVETGGVKMTIASILAATIMGIAIWLTGKKKFKNTYVVLIVGWATIIAILFLIGRVIEDIVYIMLFGFFGLLGAAGLDVASTKAENKAGAIQKGIDLAKTEITRDEYKKEVENQNSKPKKIIRIRKREE